MKKKLLNGKMVALIFVFLILNFLTTGVLAIATWIYLTVMVRKKKIGLFHEHMEAMSAESQLQRLKIFLRVAGITFLVAVIGIVMHNVLSGLTNSDEPISFFIGFGALVVFMIATAGALLIFFQGRQKQL